jgi:predicted transcriptional regulator
MNKRGKLEIMRDILQIVKDHQNKIKPTPLLRKSNLSFHGFSEYFKEMVEKELVKEIKDRGNKYISITETGLKFIEKYKTIVDFIEEFEL